MIERERTRGLSGRRISGNLETYQGGQLDEPSLSENPGRPIHQDPDHLTKGLASRGQNRIKEMGSSFHG